MSGIIGSKLNHRGSGLIGSLGTDGQHLLSAGAGKTNVFETVTASSGLTYINSVSASDEAAMSFDGDFSATYENYIIYFSYYHHTNNTDTVMRFRQGDADLTTSNYITCLGCTEAFDGGSSLQPDNFWNAAYGRIGSGDDCDDADHRNCGQMIIYAPLDTSIYHQAHTNCMGFNSIPSYYRYWYSCNMYMANTTAMSGITFMADGANITGSARLYGLQNS